MMAGNDEDTVMTSKAADTNGGGGIRAAMRNPYAKENRGPRHHDSHNENTGRLAGGESGTFQHEKSMCACTDKNVDGGAARKIPL